MLAARQRCALTAILLAVALASLDMAMVQTALPAIAAALHTSPTDSIWVIQSFQLTVVASLLPFATQGLAFVSLPFYFTEVLGRSAVETGWLLAPWAVVVALVAPVAGGLSDRYPPGALSGIGLAILSAGMAMLGSLPSMATTADIAWRMALCGLGFGLFQSPNLRALMSSAPPERSGGASGVIAVARITGQSLGAAGVALCFGLAAGTAQGSTWALVAGAVCAALACASSWARLWVR